jgi:hypothetical protein
MLECPKGCCQVAMPEDVFCGMCGTKLEEIRKCPKCGYALFLSDVYCRKCGKSVIQSEMNQMEAEVEGRK